MKWLAAGLTLVNFTTVSGLILGILCRGLSWRVVAISLAIGLFAAVYAYLNVNDPEGARLDPVKPFTPGRYPIWKWVVITCFVLFALRSFCCLIYPEGDDLKIQSPNNLGDLALHITYIRNFANGVPLWPENPICVGSNLRYPAGTDLFNALLCLFHVDLIHGLIWTGLLGSLATGYAFYRWGGTFVLAGFLFNGGVAGFQILWPEYWMKVADYQGVATVAWKNIALSMFVTQRGFLYAIPAGLLLLWNWRGKFFRQEPSDPPDYQNGGSKTAAGWQPALPFWVELSLYATMPLFHVHTFLALSALLAVLFLCGDRSARWQIGLLIGAAFVPATFFVFLVSDQLRAKSMIQWNPGWVQKDGEFAAPFLHFWFSNFGFWVPAVLGLLGWSAWRARRDGTKPKWELLVAIGLTIAALSGWRLLAGGLHWSAAAFFVMAIALLVWCFQRIREAGFSWNEKFPEENALLVAAVGIFMAGFLFKFAAWGWDNLKLMVWGYFLLLPILWRQLISKWPAPLRMAACVALFGSGFISLFGGLAAGREGYELIGRAELDGVGHAIKQIPVEARFAAYPTYNHPLLLQGRKVVLGYPGHLWTEGFDYDPTFERLSDLMNGDEYWRDIARHLDVRYIFWGREETTNYPESKRPWEKTATLIASGTWGAIYDAQSKRQPPVLP